MVVPVLLGINMDLVLKCKLGHLVPMDFYKLKEIIFPSTRLSSNSGVHTRSRDIGHDFEKLTFTGENLILVTILRNAHHSAC